jgi:hypothetical protein
MDQTLGAPIGGPDPNPVGCRVVVFSQERWVAYLARRNDDDSFLFVPGNGTPTRLGDQRGRWPSATTPGPANATLSASGSLKTVDYP